VVQGFTGKPGLASEGLLSCKVLGVTHSTRDTLSEEMIIIIIQYLSLLMLLLVVLVIIMAPVVGRIWVC
jgi:hypothetical protein